MVLKAKELGFTLPENSIQVREMVEAMKLQLCNTKESVRWEDGHGVQLCMSFEDYTAATTALSHRCDKRSKYAMCISAAHVID